MNSLISASLIGGFYLIVLFLLCFISVCVCKIVYLYFFPPKKEQVTPAPVKKRTTKKTRLPVRKIVIRPNEINKILVESDD